MLSNNDECAMVRSNEAKALGIGIDTRMLIEAGVDGTPLNLSSDTLEVPFFKDTVLLQRLARLFYRRQFWRVGAIGFPAAFDLAGLEPCDTITINDSAIYGDSLTCVVSSVHIGADMTVTIQTDAYSQAVGALTDWTPSQYVTTTGGGDAVPAVELFPVATVSAPTQWDAQLTIDGQQILYWYAGNLWVRRRIGGAISSLQVTGV